MSWYSHGRGRLVGSLVVLVACIGTGVADAGTTAPIADRDAEFTYALPVGVDSFDPHRSVGAADALFQRQVYDRLLTFEYDDVGSVSLGPQLATSYEIGADALTIEFELRDDVTFQDGTAFDADAVRANIERALDPDSTVSSDLASVERVEVLDATHVVFHLSSPDPSVPWSLAFDTAGMMASPASFDSDLSQTPVGSGPFTLLSAAKDGEVVYERWDGYWDPDAALVRRLVITTISDPNARFNGVRSGDIDAAFMSPPTDVESEPLQAEGYHWIQSFTANSYGLFLNGNMPPLDDVRVRRAISLAINRTEVSDALLNGLQPPSWQPFNPGYLGYEPDLDEDPYDPETARALLSEAGAEGATLSVIQTMTAPHDSLAQVVQQQLAEIGLEVELMPLGVTDARSVWAEGGHHAMAATIVGQPEPSSTLTISYLSGAANLAAAPSELVDMAAAGLRLPVGSDEREQQYRDISAYLVENPIHVPIAQYSTVHLCRPQVVGCELLQDIGRVDFRGVGVRHDD